MVSELFSDKVPSPEVAARRYASVHSIDLLNPPNPKALAFFEQMLDLVRAEAWDEGCMAGGVAGAELAEYAYGHPGASNDELTSAVPKPANPYEQEARRE